MGRTKQTKESYIVKQRFQNHKDYGGKTGEEATFNEVGDDVSHFEQERLERGMALGLIEKVGGDQTESADTANDTSGNSEEENGK